MVGLLVGGKFVELRGGGLPGIETVVYLTWLWKSWHPVTVTQIFSDWHSVTDSLSLTYRRWHGAAACGSAAAACDCLTVRG